ncbi:uncharacterized protein LOC111332540 isoform X2 [Stylophora pistillata]|uniref:uncharacterized protein LOC111332540 isoform X2 n=1 Tax=Stylophora pistillata TaxID=50429 RepID=UPI000C04B685|nr:uncharacterized protein LOC111332540 isoform X2 [Stylophora pistillata]
MANVPADAEGEERPLLPNERTYLGFRSQRQAHNLNGCYRFLLKIVKITFCSLGLWSHQAWNYILRALVSLLCFYQAVYDFYVVLGCHGFDCSFLQNSTDSKKPSHHKDDRHVANAVYTIVSLAAVVSYLLFIRCFIVAKHKNSSMVAPSESLMDDLSRTDCWWLCLTFALITMLFLSSVAVFYVIIWISQPKDNYFIFLATGVGAQFFAQWTAITTCHVFAVSSFSIGTFAEHTLSRIQEFEAEHTTLEEIIIIHEELRTIVLNTVSSCSVWFMVHWLSYGVGVVISLVYMSKELISKGQNDSPTMNKVYFVLFFVCQVYLFLLPCILAAGITSRCRGVYEKINSTTSKDWTEGHPFQDRRNIALFISYAKDSGCGFKIGRITFSTSLAWLSFFFGLTGLLFHFL